MLNTSSYRKRIQFKVMISYKRIGRYNYDIKYEMIYLCYRQLSKYEKQEMEKDKIIKD